VAAQENHISLDGPIRRILATDAANAGPCPSPDIFAAYYEHSLDPEETERYDTHFATCSSCRAILSGVARASLDSMQLDTQLAAAAAPLASTEPRSDSKRLRFWLITAAASAFALVVVFTLHQRSVVSREHTAELALVREAAPAAQLPAAESAQLLPAPPQASLDKSQRELHQIAPPQLSKPVPPRVPLSPHPEVASQARTYAAGSGNGVAVGRAQTGASAGAAVSRSNAPPPPASASQSVDAATSSSATVEVNAEGAAVVPEVTPQAAPQFAPAPASAPARADQKMAQQSTQYSALSRSLKSKAALQADDHVVVKSPDGSITWTIHTNHVQYTENGQPAPVQDFLPTNSAIAAGSAPGGKVCWLVGTQGTVVLTTDGRLWMSVTPPTTANLTGVAAKNANAATVTASGGRTYVTADGGQTWKSQN
jgi:hypothetical protein